MTLKKIIGYLFGLVFFGVTFFACLICLYALWLSNRIEPAQYYQPALMPGYDLDGIEGNSKIKIPPSAMEIYAMTSGFRELDTWVRFDLPAEDLDLFLQSTSCQNSLVSSDPGKHRPDELDPDWWQPHTARRLEVCSGERDYLWQRIMVDYTNQQVLRIYVFSAIGNR